MKIIFWRRCSTAALTENTGANKTFKASPSAYTCMGGDADAKRRHASAARQENRQSLSAPTDSGTIVFCRACGDVYNSEYLRLRKRKSYLCRYSDFSLFACSIFYGGKYLCKEIIKNKSTPKGAFYFNRYTKNIYRAKVRSKEYPKPLRWRKAQCR